LRLGRPGEESPSLLLKLCKQISIAKNHVELLGNCTNHF
jgi:hypothetical protein